LRVIHMVPRLAPPVEGVGSHAEALAAALGSRCGIESRFLVGDPSWRAGQGDREMTEETASAAGSLALPLRARTPEALAEALAECEATRVLLHYAGYGYSPRGVPTWLVEGLVRWRRQCSSGRLVTLFHEVWATGPPWRSSFWLAPRQRRLAAALAALSGSMVTSLDLYGQMLRRWAGDRPVRVIPVFSTIGEPVAEPSSGERQPRMVVFGSAGVRSRAWTREKPSLAAACDELAIEEVLDIGPPAGAPDRIGDKPVRALGILPAASVQALLLGSRAGFLGYPPSFLPKSTIFAAYCAHGLLPVCAWSRRSPSAGPLPPFWPPGAALSGAGACGPADVAQLARSWYSEHDLACQADSFREMLACGS
jgi:hypothetical protein